MNYTYYDSRDLVRFCNLGYFHTVGLSSLDNFLIVIREKKKQTKILYATLRTCKLMQGKVAKRGNARQTSRLI